MLHQTGMIKKDFHRNSLTRMPIMDHPSKFQSCNDWSQMSDVQPCSQGHLIIRCCPKMFDCQYKKDLKLYLKSIVSILVMMD